MIRRLNCPVCDRVLPSEIDGNNSLFPFCGIRCKQVDLYRWMSGDYALIEKLTPDQLEEQQDSPPQEFLS
ncbi:MAG TPA: DNA gyrase inhibitor YacG [Planctomicrobium sp.]|nr:DNA gyrase inhibitor YacG [Planctomicrobium sp.]